MKSNTHNIKAITVLWFRLYLHVKLEKQHNILFDWEFCTSAPACWTELTHREREVCARWDSKTSCTRGSTGDSQNLNKVWALFLREKKLLKGSAMLLSWQHCAYPFLQLRVGPRVKQKIRHFGNTETLTALIYIYIYIYTHTHTHTHTHSRWKLY